MKKNHDRLTYAKCIGSGCNWMGGPAEIWVNPEDRPASGRQHVLVHGPLAEEIAEHHRQSREGHSGHRSYRIITLPQSESAYVECMHEKPFTNDPRNTVFGHPDEEYATFDVPEIEVTW